MSSKKFIEINSSRGQARSAMPRRMKITIAIVAVLAMFGTWTVLAYSGVFDPVFKQKKKSSDVMSIQSFNANAPSKEYVYGGGSSLIAIEEPPCGDTQPPTFPNGCPSNIITAASYQYPFATSLPVSYTTPVATDNSTGVTVSCSPASGSSFAVGTTTVTCTATDICANTATCSFTLMVFSGFMVDDTNNQLAVLFSVIPGASYNFYFCQNGVSIASGTGTITTNGNNVTIDNTKGDRVVHISVNGTLTGNGTATITKTSGTLVTKITDAKLSNDARPCP